MIVILKAGNITYADVSNIGCIQCSSCCNNYIQQMDKTLRETQEKRLKLKRGFRILDPEKKKKEHTTIMVQPLTILLLCMSPSDPSELYASLRLLLHLLLLLLGRRVRETQQQVLVSLFFLLHSLSLFETLLSKKAAGMRCMHACHATSRQQHFGVM